MAKTPRPLGFKDRSVWELQQTVLARFDDFDDFTDRFVFPDLTTPVPLVLYLSQEEFTKLYSAVLTGADLTYPNQSHDIEYLYLQMVALEMAQLCAALADCITNSSVTQIALNIFLQNNGYGTGGGNPTGPLPVEVTGQNLLPPGYVCGDDEAFGMAGAVVDGINEAVTEVLQAIEILTNPLEIAAEMADNMPGVSVLTTGADVANWIQDTAKEAYDLAWSTSIRDELACLVWCAFKNGCELSFDTLWDVYLLAAEETPPAPTDLESWLIWMVALPYGDALQTVSAISMLGLLAMRYGGKFGQFVLGIRSLETIIQLSESASDSNWSIVCTDPCGPDWCITHDWTIDAQGWTVVTTPQAAGVLIGTGWQHTDIITPSDERRRSVRIEKAFTSALVTKIDLLLDHTQGLFHDNTGAFIYVTELSTVITNVYTLLRDDMTDGNDQQITWQDGAGQQMDELEIFIRSSKDITVPYAYGGNILLKSIEICGNDPEPGDL